MADEGKLRRAVEKATDEVNQLRVKFHAGDQKAGDKLPQARAKASKALSALWDACPEEKPPTQRVL